MSHPTTSTDRLVTTAEVMDRYSIQTPRAARRVMAEVGCFEVAGRLFVREADLLAHESDLMAARRPSGSRSPSRSRRGRRSREKGSRGWDHSNLSADFWQKDSQSSPERR